MRKNKSIGIFLALIWALVGIALVCATVPDVTNKITSSCNGSTTAFSFTFPIVDTSDLVVILRVTATGAETVLTETTHYVVSATNNDYSSGGTVTTVSTYLSGRTLTIIRNVPESQNADLEDSKVLRLADLVGAFDRLTLLVQDLEEELGRAIKIPRTETINMELDVDITRASQYLGFDSSGAPTTLSSGLDAGSITLSTYMETIVQVADEGALKTATNLEIGTDVLAYIDLTGYTATLGLADLKLKGPLADIRAYGAIEDGATDASTAIQAAIDAAEQSATVNKGRGVVLIPCVTSLGYKCDADIQLKDQILITGGGMIEFSGTYGFESNAKSGWVIDGITILGSETTGQVGVYIHNASVKWWIRNCQFYDTEIGIFGTKTYFGQITNNDMYLVGMVNTSCIKLTSGEGNCSKGTAYGTVKVIGIRGNLFKEYGDVTSAEPLIWIGDSALAPVDPQLITHALQIDISGNGITGKYSAAGVQLENTKRIVIERNWFERFVGPAIYLAGQFHYSTTIRANGIWGNNDDDHMDPAIKVDSTNNWNTYNLTIAQNEFWTIHANHNYLEIDNTIGLAIDNNSSLDLARIVLTTCTGVDIRQPEWTHIFDTFADADATPSVKFKRIFLTVGTTTITDFDDGTTGQIITVVAETSITITDGTNIFLRGSANWAMTATDTLTLIQKADGKWYELSRKIDSAQTYTVTNVVTDRSYDADSVAVAELADIVGTLIVDLRARGIVK